jgi:predicted MFS family arabinose efflux permease
MLGLNRNIWLLVLIQPFALAVSPAIVLISGFVGKELAPVPALATLPLSMMIVGITMGAMPAAFLMQRFGRKTVFLSSMGLSAVACVVATLGIQLASFTLFIIGVTMAGMTMSAVHQFRFAAVENVSKPDLAGRAISVLMLGSVAAAFIGTEFAALGQNLLSVNYAGSFLTLTLASLIAFILLLFFKNTEAKQQDTKTEEPVDMRAIARRPAFILALGSAAIGYGVMSFVMTATPLAMHDMSGHSLGDTKWVIQSHIMAMFLPSLFTGELIRKFGVLKIMFVGLLAYLGTTTFAYSGAEVFHYWWALVLLGIGWNFLFIGGTTLLTTSYKPHEKFKVQAVNDLTVFVFQALSSFSAGAILFFGGWSSIVTISLIPTLILFVALVWLWRPVSRAKAE